VTEPQSRPAPPARRGHQVPDRIPLPDRALYERLIGEGIAAADRQGTAVDHVTARRLAIMLAARPQPPDFAQDLTRFIRTGAITKGLKNQLRVRSRSGTSSDRPESARLMEYCLARNTHPGPVGENFGRDCDQIDQSDVMLQGLRDRASQRAIVPAQAAPGIHGPHIVALAGQDRDSRTVSLILDESTANLAIFAIAAHAEEREAHVREVQRYGQALPEGSYGRNNREAIAAREKRVAARLRAVEHAYRTALDRGAAPVPPGLTATYRLPEHPTDKEIELE